MVQWYYQGPAGEQLGPVSADELRKLAGAGHVVPDTLVRRGDDVEWASARRVKGLFTKPHVAEPSGRVLPTLAHRVKRLLTKLVPKMRHGPRKPETGLPLPPPLPGRPGRILVPVLLSVLIAVASLSAVLQACILQRLSSVPVTIKNRELDVNVKNYELGVNVRNSTLDVNVENSTLDVNVENDRLDVNLWDHWILEGDPIPVRIVH